jgi:outer membrane protein OmpA-like peptidoglycan-associated protein
MWLARLVAIAVLASLSTVSFSVTPAEAQFGKRLKERLKRNAEDKAIDKAVEKENEAIDAATAGDGEEDTARTTATPTEPGSTATADAPADTGTATDAPPTDRKVWANYDFVPGQRVLFFSDFTEDQVGNFPQRLEFKTGQMEIVEFEGGQRALKASSGSDLIIPLPAMLPEKFTIELDLINRKSRGTAANTFELEGGRAYRDGNTDSSTKIGWGHNGFDLYGGGTQVSVQAKEADVERYVGKPVSFRMLADGKALKLYADEKRIANVPNASFKRDKALFLRLEGRDDEESAVYLTRIRIAESQKSIYDELAAKGRWTTQGILFNTGKSDVKPESTPTLKQIAAALKEHPELKVEIQGHTDNVGKADANLKLSQARAEAVKKVLAAEYGVSADQLTAKGYGDTKPSADNKTAEGRANNRRVELVKS